MSESIALTPHITINSKMPVKAVSGQIYWFFAFWKAKSFIAECDTATSNHVYIASRRLKIVDPTVFVFFFETFPYASIQKKKKFNSSLAEDLSICTSSKTAIFFI